MFIVIEGIDGAGCETQAKLVFEKLQKAGQKVFLQKYPHYDTPVGKKIKDFLYKNEKMTADEQFKLYTMQFIDDQPLIIKKRTEGIFIADRFFTTTLCFQTLEGYDEKKALDYAKSQKIEKPTLVFYLDVRPEIAAKRKFGENKVLNFREKDLAFMQKTYVKYDELVKRQVWAKWIKINGERKPDKIAQDIVDKISSAVSC